MLPLQKWSHTLCYHSRNGHMPHITIPEMVTHPMLPFQKWSHTPRYHSRNGHMPHVTTPEMIKRLCYHSLNDKAPLLTIFDVMDHGCRGTEPWECSNLIGFMKIVHLTKNSQDIIEHYSVVWSFIFCWKCIFISQQKWRKVSNFDLYNNF